MNEILASASDTSTIAVVEKETNGTDKQPLIIGNDDYMTKTNKLFINEISNDITLKTEEEEEEMDIRYDNSEILSQSSSPSSLSSIIKHVAEELTCEEDNLFNKVYNDATSTSTASIISHEKNISDDYHDVDDHDHDDIVQNITKKLEKIDIKIKEEPSSLEDNDDDDDVNNNNNINDNNNWEHDLQSNAAFEMSKTFEDNNELMMLELRRQDDEQQQQQQHTNNNIINNDDNVSAEEDLLSSSDDEDDDDHDDNNICMLMNHYDGTFPTKKIEHNLDVVNEDEDGDDDDDEDCSNDNNYNDDHYNNDNNESSNDNQTDDDCDELDDKENMPNDDAGALGKPPLPPNINTNAFADKPSIINTHNNTLSSSSSPQSNKVLPPQSPSMMTFPAILEMWEDRAVASTTNNSINILDCLNESNLSYPNIVPIHDDNNDSAALLNNDISLLTDHNDNDDDDDLMIMPDADKIFALEFIDDKPLDADFELDCDDDDDNNDDDDDDTTADNTNDGSQQNNNNNSPITTPTKSITMNTPPPSSTKKDRFSRFRSNGNNNNSKNNTPSKRLPSPFKKSNQQQQNHSPMSSSITTTPTKQQRCYQTPIIDKITCSGTISTRLSLKTLLTKKWHINNYYIQYGPTCVIIFRNHDDFHNWLHNPYLDKKKRDYLIRFYVDFCDEMENNKSIRGFKLTDIKAKTYKKGSPAMYNFKLEKWTDLGQSLYGAFACTEKYNIEHFHSILSSCLYKCPDHGLRSISDLLVS